MSSAERVVRHHRYQSDRVISQAYARLAWHPSALATFDQLLFVVRVRARRLLDAPVVSGHHPGIEALVNLSRFAHAHIRRIEDWPGTSESWHRAVSSLAEHLVCEFPVPRFLAGAWCATDEAYGDKKRRWFIAHGRGASMRSLDLPIGMTRKMERLFLTSPDHLGIEEAMRRAELLALGAPADIVRAVLTTALGTDLRHDDFWRTVWMFVIANARAIELTQVGPLVDFIHAIRHERITVETPEGIVTREPPQPAFSMKGRTVSSMLRLMQDWHRSLGTANGGLTWNPSSLRPMLIEEPAENPSAPPKLWHLMELTSGEELRTEGAALHHCVASYADRCWRGATRIWSLRVRRGGKVRHVLTIEINTWKWAIVQARGWRNRAPSGKALRILRDWAVRERLRLAI